MEKEQWKADILNSLEGIKRAEPDPQLYDRILVKTGAGQMRLVRRPNLAIAAACLVLLVLANVLVLRQNSNDVPATSVYQLDNADFDLYSQIEK